MARPYDAAAAMGGLSLKEGEGVSSKAARFPVRPGLGKAGRKCILFANHFFAKFKPDLELYHYDVSALSPVRVPSIPAWSLLICSLLRRANNGWDIGWTRLLYKKLFSQVHDRCYQLCA